MTDKHRKDVDSADDFPTVFAYLVTEVTDLEKEHNIDEVAQVGYNLLPDDHPWLRTMCIKHGISWPTTWKWGWDIYRSLKYVTPCPVYRAAIVCT